MYTFLHFTCPVLGFVLLAVVAAAYLLFDMITIKGEAVHTDMMDAASPTYQRLRFAVRPPRVGKVLKVVVLALVYTIPAALLIKVYNRVQHTTIHFVDADTGRPITQPLSSVPPDPSRVDANSPDVIIQYRPGVAEVTWHHGDGMTITVEGYETWGGDLDGLNLPAVAEVKLTVLPDATTTSTTTIPATAPATGPSAATIPSAG